jgi:hypothetical protein
MVAGCILEMASSSARSLMILHANVSDQPGKVSVVEPLEELTRAIQGERIWHEEDQQCRIHPLLEWLQA